jgi:hypothetical protein
MAEPIIELTIRGTDKVGAVACGECRIVALNREAAASCCVPRRCECGAEASSRWDATCRECATRKAREERERDLAREAAKLADCENTIADAEYSGPVYLEGLGGSGDGYFANVGELIDHCQQMGEPVPARVWACHINRGFTIDADSVLEDALQDHHEDAHEQCDGDLQAILDAWCAKQNVESWEADETRAVVIEEAGDA